MIVELQEDLLLSAARIHSVAWQASHAGFCSEAFLAQHTVENQKNYILGELSSGKRFYVLIRDIPVGIVSVQGNLIENLYVLPDRQQHGCGTELLTFAIKQCKGTPHLWILDNNQRAYELYVRHGFALTGRKHPLSQTLSEVEMKQTSAALPD